VGRSGQGDRDRDTFLSQALSDRPAVFNSHWVFRLDHAELAECFADAFGHRGVTILPHDRRDEVASVLWSFRSFFGESRIHLAPGLRLNQSRPAGSPH
jgi:hypothetical protein